MNSALQLGTFVFDGFEVPEKLPFGGEQKLAVHDLPGGTRVVDAMGAFDDDISWSGRFRGANGETRARQLDLMRAQGRALTLSCGTFQRLVVIRHFKAHYEYLSEIPYEITLLVVKNQDNPALVGPSGLDSLVGADINSVQILGTRLSLSSLTTPLANLQTAYSAWQAVKSGNISAAAISNLAQTASIATGLLAGGLDATTGLRSAVATTAQAVQQAMITANAATMMGATIASGASPLASANILIAQAQGFDQMGALRGMQGLLQRIDTNLGGAPGGISWNGPRVAGVP